MTPMRYQVIPELSTNLLLGLNHANATSRLAAVRYLMKKVKQRDQVSYKGQLYAFHRLLHIN
jgi:hypothetical protein